MPEQPAPTPNVRTRILDAAIDTLMEDGPRGLKQTRIAQRAGIRQSHLTHYFPTRDRLLEAITTCAVDHLTDHLTHLGGHSGSALTALANAITDTPHMRMFLTLAVEADHDEILRGILTAGVKRLEGAIAEHLAVTPDQARPLMAALWGAGLYHFLTRSDASRALTGTFVTRLARATDHDERPKR